MIIENDSSLEIKYDMFKRLNTNSEQLTDQEMRNCIYRGELNDIIKDISKNKDLRDCLNLTPKQADQMLYEEYILRILAFSRQELVSKFLKENTKNYSDKQYLDYFMENYKDDSSFNLEEIKKNMLEYIKIIQSLNKLAKKRIFGIFNNGRFSLSNFDMLSIYIFKKISVDFVDIACEDLYKDYIFFMEDKKEQKGIEKINTSSRQRSLERIKLFNDYINNKK